MGLHTTYAYAAHRRGDGTDSQRGIVYHLTGHQCHDVIVAVDTTGSMAVADATYGSEKTITRIDAARQAVHDVTAAYPDASFAALRFGASGTLDVPLTPGCAGHR